MARIITVTHATGDGEVLKNFLVENNSLSLETLKTYFPLVDGLSYVINSIGCQVYEINAKLILHAEINNYETCIFKSDSQIHIDDDTSLRTNLIKKYFYKKYTYSEICGMLKKRHGIQISIRTLKRILNGLQLRRKNMKEDNLEKIVLAIMQEVHGDGCNLGYRALWRRLQNVYQIQAKMSTVLEVLRVVDPDGVNARLRHRLRRRIYSAPGPNFIWHIDGNDKLKKDGFAIHACIDGYSKKIIWLKVGSSNNDPKIISGYYLEAVEKCGLLPTLLRSDRGTENSKVELLQIALRYHHDDALAREKSYLSGKSTANQRIEHYWCILRHQVLDYYRDYFHSMRHRLVLDISDSLHIELLRFCFGNLIQNSLDTIKTEWKDHRIRKQKNRNIPGTIPNVMYYWPEKYDSKNYGKSVNIVSLQPLYRDYVTESKLYSTDVALLVKLLMPELVKPTTCEEAESLFIKLLNMTLEYV